MGANDIEEAKIDSICEGVRDIKEQFLNLSRYKENNFLEKKDNYFNVTLRQELEDLVKLMDTGNYSINGALSLADILIYCLVTMTFTGTTLTGVCHKEEAMKTAYSIYKIREIVYRVSNESGVREWTKKHPI